MNQHDREAISALTESINALARKVDGLDYLAEDEAVKALKGLVEIAPTLKKLSQAYEAASWFTSAVKVIGAIAAAGLAIAAFGQLYFGGKQ